MTRNQYTFAVVSRSLERDVLRLLDGPGKDRAVAAAELIRARMDGSNGPQVAYYRDLMDGWNRTHSRHEGRIVGLFPAAAGLISQLDERGWWFGPAGSFWGEDRVDPRRLVREMAAGRSGDPGRYALTAFVHALVDLSEFQRATGGAGFCLWRCLGVVHSDEEFALPSGD